jgi:hypothetical protein
MYNSQSLSTNNLSSDSWDIQHSRDGRKEKLSSEKILGLCEEYFIETQDSLNAIIDDKLKQWKQNSDANKKLIDEGRKNQDNLPQNSATNWLMIMQNSFANHHAQKNLSTSQLDYERLGDRAFQYPIETPSAVSKLDGSRNNKDMPVVKLDFNLPPLATRLV